MDQEQNKKDVIAPAAKEAAAREAKKAAAHQTPHERITHQLQRNPFLDWAIILASSVILALALVAVGVYVYLDTGVRLDAPSNGQKTFSHAPIDVNALQGVLGEFDARAAERAALGKGYNGPIDPSLP